MGMSPESPRPTPDSSPLLLTRYALLSLLTAVVVLVLKLLAWWLTDSVGLFSDALETLTNVGGATMALMMLRTAAQPPDEEHSYGHNKAEYFSSGFEGMLIFLAAVLIVIEAVVRLQAPQPLAVPALGLVIAALAGGLNLMMSRVLVRAGRRYDSITLTADGRHLLTDVWTTVGVIVGVGLVALTHWWWLDSAVAMAVAVYVLWTGFQLLRESVAGLMDTAWPESEQAVLQGILDEFRREGAPGEIDFHAIRTRRSASRRFVNFHVLVPGAWTVKRGHDLVERLEDRVARELPQVTAFTHLEPSDDPLSYADEGLDRPERS